MKDIEKTNWNKKLASVWAKFPSPARPSKGEVTIFKKYLEFQHFQKRRKMRVLILGSTPEFRDFCKADYIDVYCIDINRKVYESLASLVRHKNKKEKFINENWLKFKTSFKFDVIMGDAVSSMLPVRKYRQFFKNMHRHLGKEALLVIRLIIQKKEFMISPKKAINDFRKNYKKMDINIFTATHNQFFLYYLDKKRSKFSMVNLLKKLQQLYKKGLYTQEEYDKLLFYYTTNSLTISVPKQEYIEKVLNEFFSVKAKEFSLDYLSSFCNPIYILEKK